MKPPYGGANRKLSALQFFNLVSQCCINIRWSNLLLVLIGFLYVAESNTTLVLLAFHVGLNRISKEGKGTVRVYFNIL